MSSDTYRRLAAHAEELAQSAKKDTDREAWLRIAEDWLNLAATGFKIRTAQTCRLTQEPRCGDDDDIS
jgi:hypothetical protein